MLVIGPSLEAATSTGVMVEASRVPEAGDVEASFDERQTAMALLQESGLLQTFVALQAC